MAIAIAIAIAVAGCGSDDDGSGRTTTGSSGGGSVAPLTVALATTQSDILNYIAAAEGYFDDEGVDVTIQDDTQATTTSLIVSGRADIAALSSVGPITAAQQGKDTSIVYGISGGGVGGYMIGNSKTAETLADLQALDSCTIATFPAGTSSFGYGTLYQKEVNPNCKVTPLQDASSQVGAVTSGRVDAAVGGFAFLNPVVQDGRASVLIDTLKASDRGKYIGPDFVEVVFWGAKDRLDEKRDSVERWLKAIDKARKFVASSSDAELAQTLSELKAYAPIPKDQLDDIAKSFKTYMPLGNTDGYIDGQQWGNAAKGYSSFGIPNYDPNAPDVSYDARVDMSFYSDALGKPAQ